ncbi:MAG: tetratricopeptide repeat protein [Polyangiales bacterium]
MSDFGFDAYALDDLDTSGQPDPLEIAHDLIADGKPRAALDLLGDHHDQLRDDPEYLLLCSSAWWACGDALRAQQALQGAARLAPDDPRPLEGLGEILAERGEHEKAEILFAKARALETRASVIEAPTDENEPETRDDLIAFAERRERTAQAALTPKQILFGIVAILLLGLMIAGISFLTAPAEERESARAKPKAEVAIPVTDDVPFDDAKSVGLADEPVAEVHLDSAVVEPVFVPAEVESTHTDVTVADEPTAAAVAEVEAPAPSTTPIRKSVIPKRASTPTRPPRNKAKSSPATPIAPAPEPPSDSVVQAELASMNPEELTLRADRLYTQGHSGAAASYYRRALEIDPDYAPALVGMGRGILRAKKYSDAMKNATRALQLARGVDSRPGLEAAAIYQMGRVHYERGERDAARRLFRQAISLPGAPPETWFYLGEALSSDNSPAARQAYEKYLERVPSGHLADRARRAIQ